jgi:pyrroline-5-carboxylate reductase
MLGNPNAPIVRCMPNTPALVRMGAAGLFASAEVTEAQQAQVEAVMRCVGTTLWVEEEQLLEAVTAVSGSGPAYFFAFMEAMIAKGEELGLSHDQATALTLRTALGAATLAEEQNIAIDVLRRQVTSPGGTTEQALASFSASGLNTVVADAMQACFDRALTMAKEFK